MASEPSDALVAGLELVCSQIGEWANHEFTGHRADAIKLVQNAIKHCSFTCKPLRRVLFPLFLANYEFTIATSHRMKRLVSTHKHFLPMIVHVRFMIIEDDGGIFQRLCISDVVHLLDQMPKCKTCRMSIGELPPERANTPLDLGASNTLEALDLVVTSTMLDVVPRTLETWFPQITQLGLCITDQGKWPKFAPLQHSCLRNLQLSALPAKLSSTKAIKLLLSQRTIRNLQGVMVPDTALFVNDRYLINNLPNLDGFTGIDRPDAPVTLTIETIKRFKSFSTLTHLFLGGCRSYLPVGETLFHIPPTLEHLEFNAYIDGSQLEPILMASSRCQSLKTLRLHLELHPKEGGKGVWDMLMPLNLVCQASNVYFTMTLMQREMMRHSSNFFGEGTSKKEATESPEESS